MNKDKVEKIFEIFQKNDPSPKTELEFKNEYTLLVAIVLSAQATDTSVNKATKALFQSVDSPEKMVKLGEEKLKGYIKTIGLFNSKAKNVIALSEKLLAEHSGKVPDTFEKLIALPGVGNKTANVFLNCFHAKPVIAVDTHVFRVSNRSGLTNTKTADDTAVALMKVVPDKFKLHAHHWLILHGRYTCKARKPECKKCVIYDYCEFKQKTA